MKRLLSDRTAQTSTIISFFIAGLITIVFFQITYPVIDLALNEQSTTPTPQPTNVWQPTPIPTQSPEEIAKAKETIDGIWNFFLGVIVLIGSVILLLIIYANIEIIIFYFVILISWLIGDKTVKQRVQRIRDIKAWRNNKPNKVIE